MARRGWRYEFAWEAAGAVAAAPATPIALVASVNAAPGANGGTTAAIDTTEATFIIIGSSQHQPTVPTVTDSKGNSYSALSLHANGNGNHRFFYILDPVVGTGHTFTVTASSIYPTIFVYAFSGVGSYQTESGATAASGTGPLATGSVTPSANGALVITGLAACCTLRTDTVMPVEFTKATIPYVFGNMQGSFAWQVQSVAAAINPTWSWDGNQAAGIAVSTAVFLP